MDSHRLAEIFPLIEGDAFAELVADIQTHGLREPIVVYEGKILDGRNRYRACLAAGVEPAFNVYTGDDPISYVISLNLRRRHLNESQRAMVAARLANMRQGERTDLPPIGGRFVSQKDAAQLLNVGLRSVERAKIVNEQGDPELVAAVEQGVISVSGAVEQIRRGIVTGVAMDPHAERGHDLYETPPEATRALLEVESFDGVIWEPANGRGAISRVLRAAGYRVIATDLVDYDCPNAAGGMDFLAQTSTPEGVTTILTNPPYMHSNEFVRHALRLAPRVVMLLRLLFLETTGRSDILDGGQLARVYVFRERIQTHRDGWEGPRSSNPMALAWFVWERDHKGPTVLHRISRHGDEAPPPAINSDTNGSARVH